MGGYSDGWTDRQRGRQTPYGRIDIKGDYYIYIYIYIYMCVCVCVCVCVCDSIGLTRETVLMNIYIILNGFRGKAV